MYHLLNAKSVLTHIRFLRMESVLNLKILVKSVKNFNKINRLGYVSNVNRNFIQVVKIVNLLLKKLKIVKFMIQNLHVNNAQLITIERIIIVP